MARGGERGGNGAAVLENDLRQQIVDACRTLDRGGLNAGTSGNVSVRCGNRMLVTPSAVPVDRMQPDQIAALALEGDGAWEGPLKPSSEWRFHFDILNARPEAGAIVHSHAPYCTALAMTRRGIPAAHYMVAAFGGHDVRCAGYARFGTQALSDLALTALDGRTACLLANHGMIALGDRLEQALWRANELEVLARQYFHTLLIGGPVLLSTDQIDATLEAFGSYGVQDDKLA